MFTIVLGVNPIDSSPVDRSAANILRAAVEFIPYGALITRALDMYGIFERAGAWIEGQLASLGLSGASIKQSLMQFLGTLNPASLINPAGIWNDAKRIFAGPIDGIISLVKSAGAFFIELLKDAILRPLADMAAQSPGWDLLCAVLGKNPITGDAVPRNAETLIGGFMKLIGQEEIWENIKKANAIARCLAWFQGALAGLRGFVQEVPGLFLSAVKALQIADIVVLPVAFAKVARAFGGFLVRFGSWALNTIWDLLEIVFAVVAPGVITYVKKAAAAFKSILKNPAGFVGNLINAGKQGLGQFASNITTHLKQGLLDWLTGALSGAGIYVPQALTLVEFGKCLLSVLGISWPKIRAKIVKALGSNGEKIMKTLETGFDVVVALVQGGPTAAWALIKDKLANLRDMMLQTVIDFVKDRIVKVAIAKFIAMFIPGAGYIEAILKAYDAIMVFVQRLQQIAAVVAAFIDAIAAIANGQIGPAANRVEKVMAGMLSLVIAFLARSVGLNKVTDFLVGKFKALQAKVDSALDFAINWIVGKAKAILAKLMGKGKDAKSADVRKRVTQALMTALAAGYTRSAAIGITRQVEARFLADGLRRIVAGPVKRDGSYEILVEASPLAPAFIMKHKQKFAQRRKGIIVVMVATIEFSVEQILKKGTSKIETVGTFKKEKYNYNDPPFSKTKKIGTNKDMAFYVANPETGVALLHPDPNPFLPFNTAPQNLPDPQAPVQAPAASKVWQSMSWNVAEERDPQKGGTDNHAEAKFIKWFTNSVVSNKDQIKTLLSLKLHINRSPCGYCTDKLTSLAAKLKKQSPPPRLDITWDELHTGDTATTTKDVDDLKVNFDVDPLAPVPL